MRSVKVAPGVEWTVEKGGLLLRVPGGQFEQIGYPEAAVWDLLNRNYSVEQAIELAAHIAGLNRDASRDLVAASVEKWTAKGLLC